MNSTPSPSLNMPRVNRWKPKSSSLPSFAHLANFIFYPLLREEMDGVIEASADGGFDIPLTPEVPPTDPSPRRLGTSSLTSTVRDLSIFRRKNKCQDTLT